MTQRFPAAPPVGTMMSPTRPSGDARALLALRRSAGKNTLGDPGPGEDDLLQLLRVATRVPDHRRLEPWRFITFTGQDRIKFGQKIAQIYHADTQDAEADALAIEADRLMRAPAVIAIISSPTPSHKTPVWEQELSVGAVCQNLLLAANASGWAGVWLTEWIAFHAGIHLALGLKSTERIAGFIYLGTARANPPERPRARIEDKVKRYSDIA